MRIVKTRDYIYVAHAPATSMYAWMCSCVQEVEDERVFGQKKANISERKLIDFNVCYLSQERRTDPAS